MSQESMSALVVRVTDGRPPTLCKEDIPIPCPAGNQVLIKISDVAQNPTDGMSHVECPRENWP